MKQVEPSLKERAGRMYRRLVLLQRLFHGMRQDDDAESSASDDQSRDLALSAAVREVLDELTEHARLLTSIPFPLSEWRPGDTRDDERWRALTDMERRELVSMVSGYDDLITWAEDMTRGQMELATLGEASAGHLATQMAPTRTQLDAIEYLKAERTRLGRYRQEMRFLNRRPSAG